MTAKLPSYFYLQEKTLKKSFSSFPLKNQERFFGIRTEFRPKYFFKHLSGRNQIRCSMYSFQIFSSVLVFLHFQWTILWLKSNKTVFQNYFRKELQNIHVAPEHTKLCQSLHPSQFTDLKTFYLCVALKRFSLKKYYYVTFLFYTFISSLQEK